ncbi:MAG: hypothetical protein JXI32_08910 [Deltaproteobacteria bacterium]|nr:hypothetical protein [Deltaproteobacteria bacterium]
MIQSGGTPRVIHLNHSKREGASRADRRGNIGKGLFRLAMGDASLGGVPKIMDHPGDIEHVQLPRRFA